MMQEADFVLFRPNFEPSDAGRTRIYDPTVLHPNAPTYQRASIRQPDHVITLGRSRKNSIYLEGCRGAGKLFFPLVFSSYGNVSQEVFDLVFQLATAFTEKLSWPLSVAVFHIQIAINATLMRQNAALLLKRFATAVTVRSETTPIHPNPPPSDVNWDQFSLASFDLESLSSPETTLWSFLNSNLGSCN
jgi:hypothetical protein